MNEPRTSERSTRLSEDRRRGLDYSPVFAIAAYEIEELDGKHIGRHCGIFGNEVDAESWLETGEPKPRPFKHPSRKDADA